MDASVSGGILLRDGRRIPRIGFGTYDVAPEAAQEAVEGALEAGYRLLDCARLYGNEREVGRAISQAGVARDELFVTSKVWNDRQLAGEAAVRESLEESLRALNVDYLDLLLIHWPVAGKFCSTWAQFERFKAEGLVRSIGVSNFLESHLDELAQGGATEMPVVDQIEFHPYMQDGAALAACKRWGIAVEAWSPLARGLCVDDSAIAAIAGAHGADAGQVVLAWEIARGVVPLPRSTKPARIVSNLEALSLALELTPDELAQIDALDRGRYVSPGATPHDFEVLNTLPSPHD